MHNVYSVGQVNTYIKNMFTYDPMLSRIYVRGEVSNCKYHTSGHIYFSLKDETSNISCVMFAGSRKGLAFPMKNGQSVIVFGSISVYEKDGKYQIYAKEIRLDGVGLLYERFEALKQKLEEMGMFSPQYKQSIPVYAKKVGIVTAPTGAAIRDIMNISYRRNPYVELILYPALVQGEGAAQSIVKGIRLLDQLSPDVIIVGRGGGSIEDLWAFNEEIVAEAIFNCSTPVISAVGHETDFTIADYVADLRAPTPSAAAELAVADLSQISEQMNKERQRLQRALKGRIETEQFRLRQYRTRLNYLSPQNKVREMNQQLMEKEEKLQYLMETVMKNKYHQIRLYTERLKGLSPLDKLNQGFSFTADEREKTVTEIGQVKAGDPLHIYVSDGMIDAEVISTKSLRYQTEEE